VSEQDSLVNNGFNGIPPQRKREFLMENLVIQGNAFTPPASYYYYDDKVLLHYPLLSVDQGERMIKAGKRTVFLAGLLGVLNVAASFEGLNWQPVRTALALLKNKNPIVPLFCPQLMNCFQDPHVKFCCQEIKNTHSWQPLTHLWGTIESNISQEKPQEIQEFIRFVILIVYSHMREVKAESTLENMLILYEKIVALPIPELLNILEILIQESDSISTEYELASSGAISWSAWIRKYWWAPPIAFFALALAFYRRWAYLTAQG